MKLKVAFLLYPTARVKVSEDSSFWIMRELVSRGHRVAYFESADLAGRAGTPLARVRKARLDPSKGYLPSPLSARPVDLADWDCVFIRKEPPFGSQYLYSLQLLETIKDRTFVINDPAGIALCNEKLFSLSFPRYAPETLVTQSIADARDFVKKLGKDVVLKPLHQKGGAGIFRSGPQDRNLPSLLESATTFGTERIMVQRYVPAERWGDKRILILDGKILGTFLRWPPRHDFRANLSVGGVMRRARITPFDEELVEALRPKLSTYGLYFVGIDVIGRCLTELNVTSPAGLPEIHHFHRRRGEAAVADFIERRVSLLASRRS